MTSTALISRVLIACVAEPHDTRQCACGMCTRHFNSDSFVRMEPPGGELFRLLVEVCERNDCISWHHSLVTGLLGVVLESSFCM